jgi:hypothetical protein
LFHLRLQFTFDPVICRQLQKQGGLIGDALSFPTHDRHLEFLLARPAFLKAFFGIVRKNKARYKKSAARRRSAESIASHTPRPFAKSRIPN